MPTFKQKFSNHVSTRVKKKSTKKFSDNKFFCFSKFSVLRSLSKMFSFFKLEASYIP